MIQKILPGTLEPQGYIPLNIFEHIWLITLTGKYEHLEKVLTIDNQDDWDNFWKDCEIISKFTNLDKN